INRQKCVTESQENIAYWSEEVKRLNARDIEAANKIHARGQELAAEEAKRPKDGVKRANASSTESTPEGVEHNPELFTFDFRNARDQQTQMQPQNQQQFQQMQMQQQGMMQGQSQQYQMPSFNMGMNNQQNQMMMPQYQNQMMGQPQYYQQNQMMGQPQYYQQNQMMM